MYPHDGVKEHIGFENAIDRYSTQNHERSDDYHMKSGYIYRNTGNFTVAIHSLSRYLWTMILTVLYLTQNY